MKEEFEYDIAGFLWRVNDEEGTEKLTNKPDTDLFE